MSDQPQAIYLKDYTVPEFLIDKTELRFELHEENTRVHTRLTLRRNPQSQAQQAPLALHGHADLELVSLRCDGQAVAAEHYQRNDETLTIQGLPDACVLECETLIQPQSNTSLEGLYKSDGAFCTQCEAEGFRRITFYLDRPDVMSIFTTRVEADKSQYPVLLSNGNPVETGELAGGRHFITWEDPFPKPAYLFALVAGDLAHIQQTYTTASGREVELRLYAERKDLDKLEYAMQSLIKAMKWDEEVYGREYDLDIYMIVAVDFFNMGAMENKGLNIFNTSCVLAHPKTTTDAAFQRVEGVVAHEYFHNWSGNRVTCRDWFQLSLKEGFTVFRDAEFSADMNSATVKRIEDVTLLRTAQFAEDAGPMAHPVRPASFIEISNFYTLTVYEKGHEVVRMLRTLLGAQMFRKGSDLYFERHDGQAVTTDDFVQAMEDASGRDLSQFRLWYSQAGTPRIEVKDSFDAAHQRYTLTLKQSCPDTPEAKASEKQPFHIPVAIGLLDQNGQDLPLANGEGTQVLELTQAEQTFTFDNIAERPVPSLLRGFSAPVKCSYPYTREQLVFLMSHDSDGFNRWDASQQLAIDIMQDQISAYGVGETLKLDARLSEAYRSVLQNEQLDPAMVAKVLSLPSEAYLSELAERIDVEAIHAVRSFIEKQLAVQLEPLLLQRYRQCSSDAAYRPEADEVARRALKNLCLHYLMLLDEPECLTLAQAQYREADNMTEQFAALRCIAHSGFADAAQEALADFYTQWKDESLVVNQWLAVQASNPAPNTLVKVEQLKDHPAFAMTNPNRVRALIGAFAGQNLINFHAADGSGYRFLADQIIELNILNPQIAARLLTPLTRWRKYDRSRQALMKAALERILATANLSKDVYEVVSKSLN